MAEVTRGEVPSNGNPITSSNVLLGIPRKQSDSLEQSTITSNGQSVTTGHHDNSEAGLHGNGHLTTSDGDSPSSSSTSASENERSSESESNDEEVTDEMELKNAGVTLDLETLGSPSVEGEAPLHLVSEFVSCCVRDEHRAALILCKKVLEFEPNNQTAQEFLPILQERVKLDEELSTESSSEGSTSNTSGDEGKENTYKHSHSYHHGCST